MIFLVREEISRKYQSSEILCFVVQYFYKICFGSEFIAEKKKYPKLVVTVQDVADHIDRVKNLVGVNHVGIGSDYDGWRNFPVGLEDTSTYPNLIEELLKRNYSREEIKKIFGGNLLRVWNAVENFSKP